MLIRSLDGEMIETGNLNTGWLPVYRGEGRWIIAVPALNGYDVYRVSADDVRRLRGEPSVKEALGELESEWGETTKTTVPVSEWRKKFE